MNLWRSVVHIPEVVPGLPQVGCVARAVVRDAGYRVSSHLRQAQEHAVFQYTLSGRGVFHNAFGSHEVKAGQGFLCMVNEPGVRYQYPQGATEPWDFVFITWTGMQEVTAHLTQQGPIFFVEPKHRLIQELLQWQRYQNAPVSLSSGSSARLAQLTINTLVDSQTLSSGGIYDDLTQKFLQMLRQEIGIVDQVDGVATALGVSREHLSRTVKAQTGVTVREHLQRRRVQVACELLQTQELSVSEVARESGFHDGSHLARLFRKYMGMTPHAYKMALLKGNDWTDPGALV